MHKPPRPYLRFPLQLDQNNEEEYRLLGITLKGVAGVVECILSHKYMGEIIRKEEKTIG